MYAAVTGLATMWAGWHRAADSVAAYLVVGVWAMVSVAGVIWLGSRRRGGQAPRVPPVPLVTRRSRWPVAVAVGSFVLGTAATVALSAADSVRDTLVGSLVAFGVTALFVIGSAVAVTVAVVRTLELMDAVTGTFGRPA